MPTPIPNLARWESRMISATPPDKDAYYHKAWWAANDPNEYATDGLHYNEWYYDQTEVMYRIAQYTGDTATWYPAMDRPIAWYEQYSINQAPDGNVNGYELFPIGAYFYNLVHPGNTAVQNLMTQIATGCAWTADGASYAGYSNYGLSRELAYTIKTYIYQQKMFGNAKRANYDEVIGYVKNHPVEWFSTYAGTWPLGSMKPFMVGLTMRTLIEHYNVYADAAVPGLIKQCLDGLWQYAWVSASQTFYYESTQPTYLAPDLSLLIAPGFAWYYRQIVKYGAPGDAATYRDRGNLVWSDGVLNADLQTLSYLGKRFNQNYTWSFDYVSWYNEAEAALNPATTLTLHIAQ